MSKVKAKPTKDSELKTTAQILQSKGFKMLNADKLKEISVQWLIDSFLVKQSLVMIYAAAGNGKSYFALYLSKFLLENGKIKEVFYFDADNSAVSLKDRGIENIIKTPNLHYCGELNLRLKSTLFNELLSVNLANSLIIIDSIRNFIKGSFNDDESVMQSLDKLQSLRDKGASVVFLHHQPKQMEGENNKAYKGATSFLDSVDEGYFLYKKDNSECKELKNSEFIVLLEPQKHRFPSTKPNAFKINTANFSLEKVDYLKFAETNKAQITLNLVREILLEKTTLCQSDLAKEIKRKVEENFIEIVGRNALWRLLDKYDKVLWEISYESANLKGGKKKVFKAK